MTNRQLLSTLVFSALTTPVLSFSLSHQAFASTPVVTVKSPANGSQNTSPVNYIASASSPDCAAGIAAMRIYSQPEAITYTVDADQLNVNVNFMEGSYSTVVQAWDNCGNVGKTTVDITVKGDTLPPPKFLYSTQYSAGKVAGYYFNYQNGALFPIGQQPVWAHWGPSRIASDSGGYRLYVANQGSHDVSAYFIDRNYGYLNPVPGANFPTAGWSTDIAVHPSNHFIYVTTSDDDQSLPLSSNGVTALALQSDGSLAPVPGSPYITSGEEFALAIDPSGKYLYTTGVANDSAYTGVIDGYSIDQTTGALTPLPGSPFPIVPAKCQNCFPQEVFYDMAIDPSGKFLIGPGWENGVIYVYKIDSATGALTNVAGSPFIDGEPCSPGCPGYGPISVTVSANDRFVFVQNELISEVMSYKLDSSSGTLTLEEGNYGPYNSFSLSEDCIRADPSGTLVFALGYDTPTQQGALMGWMVDQSNGSLAPVTGAPFADNIDLKYLGDGFAITR